MAVGHVAQTVVPLGDRAKGADEWAELLEKAFEDAERSSGLLALAEDALRAHPGEALILCFAAMAALFEERSDKALIFLKRYFKRYALGDTYHLLHALALGQRNQFVPARAILKRHGLDSAWGAMRAFPGGRSRADWLLPRLGAILNSSERSSSCQPATRHAVARSHTGIGEVGTACVSASRRRPPPRISHSRPGFP